MKDSTASATQEVMPGPDDDDVVSTPKDRHSLTQDSVAELLANLNFTDDSAELSDPMARMQEIRRELTEFQLHYKFGMDEVLTKINILREEFEQTRDYSPIEHVNFRLKSMERILEKAKRYGAELSLDGIRAAIKDIAGIRITTSFVSDAFWVAEMLCTQPDVQVLEVKDYIRSPKPNGYRSLHVILQVPVYLSDRTEWVHVEVQLRTVAMDFWASLEHKIYYTYDGDVPVGIKEELHDAAERANSLDRQMADIRDKVSALRRQAPTPGQSGPGEKWDYENAGPDPQDWDWERILKWTSR